MPTISWAASFPRPRNPPLPDTASPRRRFEKFSEGLSIMAAANRDDSPAREDQTSMALRRAMKTYEGIENLKPPLERPVVTLGNFDGVHRGHQTILAATLQRAEALGRPALLVTFRPHPLKV